jgi:arginyl-tRNA synthetase
VGNDAARFFYILRKSEQSMDFYLNLAKSKSNENPVFYVQYAHARICSVMVKAQDSGQADLALLNDKYEQALIKQLSRYADKQNIEKTSRIIAHFFTQFLQSNK